MFLENQRFGVQDFQSQRQITNTKLVIVTLCGGTVEEGVYKFQKFRPYLRNFNPSLIQKKKKKNTTR